MSAGKREDDEAASDNILPYLNILNWEKNRIYVIFMLYEGHGKWL